MKVGSVAQLVERRFEAPRTQVRFLPGPLKKRCAGSSEALERRHAKAEAAGSNPAWCSEDAVVAQREEQPSRKRPSAGSTPARGFGAKECGVGSVAQRRSGGLISLRLLVRVQPSPSNWPAEVGGRRPAVGVVAQQAERRALNAEGRVRFHATQLFVFSVWGM